MVKYHPSHQSLIDMAEKSSTVSSMNKQSNNYDIINHKRVKLQPKLVGKVNAVSQFTNFTHTFAKTPNLDYAAAVFGQ